MPELVIDGRSLEVPAGTLVIDAAERLGIMIPRFCYHEALGALGACRMCAVMFVDGPIKGLHMSCMIVAQDGMVVSTDHPRAVRLRRLIIEWLMANHPHDCPVCDEGGHCLLQDETISGNHSLRRYPGRKRTYQDQDLGPFVRQEMNRCIHCYRCSRFYQEYAGGRDFGPMQIANRVFFGRYKDGRLESPFSGNIVDLCPTGVLTDKTARYRARHWDLQRGPQICPHCSLGCNTTASVRYREVVRIQPRVNPEVNGHFLCDRGRFSHGYANLPERPRQARVDGQDTTPDQALAEAFERLSDLARRHGPQSVAVLGSTRCTLETLGMLGRLAKSQGWLGPALFPDQNLALKTRLAVAGLEPDLARGLAEAAKADFILCLGTDVTNEGPMLALALRQAFRRKAKVVVADPRCLSLPLHFSRLTLPARDLPAWARLFAALAERPGDLPELAGEHLTDHLEILPSLEEIATAMAQAASPLVVCGTAGASSPELVREAGNLARALAKGKGGCGLSYLLPGPNAYGAALMENETPLSHQDVLASVAQGRIKAVLAVETDLPAGLDGLESLVVMDYVPSPAAASAQIFLPSTTLFEGGGSLVNNEGRVQYAAKIFSPGLPVRQDGQGDHPPRVFRTKAPGSDPRPAWELLGEMSGQGGHVWSVVSQQAPALAHLAPKDYPFDGPRPGPGRKPAESAPIEATPAKGLRVMYGEQLFGTEELGRYSPLVRQAAGDPVAHIEAKTGAALGLENGRPAVFSLSGHKVEMIVRLCVDMAPGLILVPGRPEILQAETAIFESGGAGS